MEAVMRDQSRRCSCCGQLVTRDQLRWDGTIEVPAGPDGPGYFLEHRTHETPDCGSTLAFERSLFDGDARRDAEATAQHQADRRRASALRRETELASIAARNLSALVGVA